jgi:hypothetical protein
MMVRRCDRCHALVDNPSSSLQWTRITPPPEPAGANTPDDADLCPTCTSSFRCWWNEARHRRAAS